jgi:acetyl-CoA carboxylase biotin carboxyl carrier protein
MDNKIDYDEINKLVSFLEEKNLIHFELEVEGFKIKISRASHPDIVQGKTTAAGASLRQESEKNPALVPPLTHESGNSLQYVTSPMVGTFYRASDPASPPFVDLGDEVKRSQTLCIIEAMKLMNEIESEVDGVIAEIYVENGKPVEYGQKLFAIQPIA